MTYELPMAEGDLRSLSENDLRKHGRSAYQFTTFLDRLKTGELILLSSTNTPQTPLFIKTEDDTSSVQWQINPEIENALEPTARSAYNARLKTVNQCEGRGTINSSNNSGGEQYVSTGYMPPVIEYTPSKLTPYERYRKCVDELQAEIESFWQKREKQEAAEREKRRIARERAAAQTTEQSARQQLSNEKAIVP